jgi:hypothetical protein
MHKSTDRGDVYIGVLISLAIFLLLSQAVLVLANTSYEMISVTRARNVAREIAQESMEVVRNLPFDSVGTIGGIPNGPLAQNQVLSRNGQNYTVATTVLYVDDPFDGVSPTDLLANDYKRVRIDVTWTGLGPRGVTTTLVTDVAPRGIEQATGGGTISILVFDSQGLPVPNSNVTISSSGITPSVNLNLQTNDNGRIVLPGAPACVRCYRVTATKSGMSTDRTYGETEVANPTKPDLTVLAGGLSEMSFTIDNLATLIINTYGSKASNFPSVGPRTFILRGGKTIGTDTLDNDIYKYNQVVSTNALGTVTLQNMEWDTYVVNEATSSADSFAGMNPLSPFLLQPGSSGLLDLSMVTKNASSLRAAFVDASRSAIASVTATLRSASTIVASSSSGLLGQPDYGQVYFDSLTSGLYTLEASASGYQPYSQNINITGTNYEEIILTP